MSNSPIESLSEPLRPPGAAAEAAEAAVKSLWVETGIAGGGGAFPNRIGLVFGVSRSAGLLASKLIVEPAGPVPPAGPTGLNTAANEGSLTSSFMSELLSALLTKLCKMLTT